MQYQEIIFQVPASQVDTAAAIANLAVPYGLYIEDYSDIEETAPKIAHVDLIEQELLERDREHALIHLYIPLEQNPGEAISFLQERFRSACVPYTITQNVVNEDDWATAWKRYYSPTKIGSRLVVVPSWESYEKKPEEIVLTMDPGMAFGTGTHETTQLCLQLLEQYIAPETRLLDIGTGSGILAIASLLLGGKEAVGVDIDETAVRVAKENSAANGVARQVEWIAGDLAQKVNGKFHIITANIVADVIIRLIPDLKRFWMPGSVFIASGIIDSREQDVIQALEDAGMKISKRVTAGGWVALAAE